MTSTVVMFGVIFAKLVLILQQHPTLSLFFLVAFSESLIFIGPIVSGAIIIIMFGAQIAMDALGFWPRVSWCCCWRRT